MRSRLITPYFLKANLLHRVFRSQNRRQLFDSAAVSWGGQQGVLMLPLVIKPVLWPDWETRRSRPDRMQGCRISDPVSYRVMFEVMPVNQTVSTVTTHTSRVPSLLLPPTCRPLPPLILELHSHEL